MTEPEMAKRLNIVPGLKSALQRFQESKSNFQVLKTIRQLDRPLESDVKRDDSPKTLFILDSSFNPPSIAHRNLAKSVLAKSYADQFAKPHRLLLLFAVMNADKAPSPAAFEQRLALMTVFAKDLLREIAEDPEKGYYDVPIDVGVTKLPYYTDKSRVIEEEGGDFYPDKPKHIHLVGFDTLTRFFAAKYYKDFDPPFSALNPYFDAGHRLRVTLRPDDEYGSVEEQKAFVGKLASGEMEKDGGKKEWHKSVELVPPNPEVGVSSTKIREAANAGDFDTVGQLCTPGVAAWVQQEKLYEEDSTGAKMA